MTIFDKMLARLVSPNRTAHFFPVQSACVNGHHALPTSIQFDGLTYKYLGSGLLYHHYQAWGEGPNVARGTISGPDCWRN